MIFQWNLSDLGCSLIALSASDPREESSQPHGGLVISTESPLGSNIACIFFLLLLYQAFIRAAGMSHAYPNQTDLISYAHKRAKTFYKHLKWGKHFPAFLTSKHGGVFFACMHCLYISYDELLLHKHLFFNKVLCTTCFPQVLIVNCGWQIVLTFVNKSITSLILHCAWSLKTPETFAKHFYMHIRHFCVSAEKLHINKPKMVKCKFSCMQNFFLFVCFSLKLIKSVNKTFVML